jgi:hypothetical protein
LQQRVSHREHDRTEENADQSKGDEAADDPGQEQNQRQVSPFPDQERSQYAVQTADDDGPHQSKRPPARLTAPVQPDHDRHEHRQGSELGNAQHEHDRRQHGGERHAGERDPDAAKYRLCDSRHHHAESHAADRLAGQQDRLLAALAGKSVSETLRSSGGAFTAGIHDRRDDNGEQKLHKDDPQAPQGRNEPGRRIAGIGRRFRDQRLDAAGGNAFPELRGPFAE